ncbi:hypothetical protein LSPCS325_41290 [Lysinibacillus sp. CTST325]
MLNDDTFFNIATEQAIQFDNGFDSLEYYYDDKRSIKFLISNIFVLLAHFTLWHAKKKNASY